MKVDPVPARSLEPVKVMGGAQEEGFLGRQVGNMIRRSVKKAFRAVYWDIVHPLPAGPKIFVCSHHGWHDGYVMYHAITKLGVRSLDWIQEFQAFPLFAKVGGMPFPVDDPATRTQTILRTIRLMRKEGRSLILFAEGRLHYGPEILPFGESFAFVADKVPQASLIPVAIRYEMALHERPEAFLRFGEPIPRGENLGERSRDALQALLTGLTMDIRDGKHRFDVLAEGTKDVNERWDMRQIPGRGGKS